MSLDCNVSAAIDFSEIPITAIKSKTRDVLSALLDPPKIILTDEGLPRDWKGLAHLINFPSTHLLSLMTNGKPTASILYTWSQQGVASANVKQLQQYLQRMDRYDVLDDTFDLLDSDAQFYMESNISSGPVVKYNNTTDNESITIDDVNLALNGSNLPQFYDAFVLYADEDIDFVQELVTRMEKYGFKLCLKDRDLLGGLRSEHAAIVKLIAERCHRLIIVFSPAFVESKLNNYIVDHALVGEIKEKSRKIIPCVYRPCEIPQSLSGFFLLYYREDGLVNFWEKLKESLLISANERLPLKNEPKANISAIPTIAITDATDSHRNSESSKTKKIQNKSDIKLNEQCTVYKAHSITEDKTNTDNPPLNKKEKKKNWFSKIKLRKPSDKSCKLNDSKKIMIAQ